MTNAIKSVSRSIGEATQCDDGNHRHVVFTAAGVRKPFDPVTFRVNVDLGDVVLATFLEFDKDPFWVQKKVGVRISADTSRIQYEELPTTFKELFDRLEPEWQSRMLFKTDMTMPIV